MAYGRRGFYARGGPSSQAGDDDKDIATPKTDRNPFYRTNDILNGVFKKNLKLEAGKRNSTDLRTIWVNFGERRYSPIKALIGPGKDMGHAIYLLECGHEWEGKSGHPVDGSKMGSCAQCGSHGAYLGFEHEWQHNAFKSDLNARALFVTAYAQQLIQQAPHIPINELEEFLHLLINAFDDLRVNSLWERVYPGSAMQIWQRWKRLTEERGDDVNTDFLSFVFAVALGVPTDPQGEFEPMRPVVEWGAQKSKYRGFGNMLITIRAVLDHCMGALLAKVPPPPPPPQQPQPQPQQGQQGQQSSSGSGQSPGSTSSSSQPQPSGSDPQDDGDEGQDGDQGDDDSDQNDGEQQVAGGGGGKAEVPPPTHIPSASQVQASPAEKTEALSKLIKGAKPLDEKEEHQKVDANSIDPRNSQALRAMVGQAMSADVEDLDKLDQQFDADEPDQDMAQAIQLLQDGSTQKSADSQLVSNAKAKILLIDVTPEGAQSTKIELTEDEKFAVNRMRTAFFKALGRQKAKRGQVGNVVDVPALIQYLVDQQDPEVFENEAVNQGFAYAILTDMSGSMSGTFPMVCHGSEMLKQSLKFPFVTGNLWGFRGGESSDGRTSDSSEVWVYRYDKNCQGYTGSARVKARGNYKPFTVPVKCGGLTPMHSAIHVVATHLQRMPSGMAKRLFILTDGSPCHVRVSGGGLPDFLLRAYVAKEINNARKHGIQVYTVVIGNHSIPDDQCKQMFGGYKFWRKTSNQGDQSIDKVLTRIVLDNFTKYIKGRG